MSSPDLVALGLLPALPAAYLRGEAAGLLEPLRFLAPDASPDGEPPSVDRATLAAALGAENATWGHPGADTLAARLADPATRVVVTGQQPGLFGGPLYTLSKAVAAAQWAERLEADGQPAVAVFWVATEDHDFAEVSRVTVPGRAGPHRWTLGDDPSPLTRVGERPLGDGIASMLASWREAYPSEAYAAWLDRLAGWHSPEARFADAFCRTLVGLLGERCPLLLDAMSPPVKRAQATGMRRLVERREELADGFAAADEAITAAGFPLQVRPQPGASPLFLQHEGARRRIEWRGPDRYGLRGVEGFEEDVSRLFEVIQAESERVSPGVLARPAFQDLVLGTHLQILGPGELSYMAQAAPSYRVLGVAGPWTSLRPQALVLGGRQRRQAEELGLSLDGLVQGGLDVAATVSALAGEEFVGPARAEIDERLAALEAPTLALDASLEPPLRKTRDQVLRTLEAFGNKVAAAAARRHEVTARRVEALAQAVRPGGSLQERVVSTAHFPGLYPGFVDALWEQLGPDPRLLHLIDPDRREP